MLAGTFEAAWPRFLDRISADLSPEIRGFGERFPSLVPWYLDQQISLNSMTAEAGAATY
ncbi:hypothetical protein [Mycolicibacterium sarraceniae]|uniref:hypothetical protein n=1 Tax=Mycolicibacterium sarraceniae TaxID=1534348 RepID=UPI0013D191D5|nr:hypothetical protein [Mycolicibacterium sarraceniae]